MAQRFFASDNAAGIHPRVLEAIQEANTGHAVAYGDDPWTARAVAALKEAFDADAEVLFTFNGTGANVVGIAAVMRAHHAVLCPDSAHLWNDECAASERFYGGKLIPVASEFGKVTPAALEKHLGPTRGVHHAKPKVVSITQPTEWGTLYTVDEIETLAGFVHDHQLLLHVDGARFANAAAALGVSLADLSTHPGVDILSFGGTKNGLLGGEAAIILNASLAPEAAYTRKQAMQLASKMRFISAQFLAYMEDELWRRLANHANAMAARLADAVNDVDGIAFVCPVQCNMLFPRMPRAALESLQRLCYFYTWDEQASIARWLTSFDTTEADVDTFASAVIETIARER
jgi:threonine aldolase